MSTGNHTVSEVTASSEVRTRSGRVSKPPVRYEPQEQVEDDYAPGDYDTTESSSIESIETSDEDEESDFDEDADDDGNLADFVVPDKNEESDSENDGATPPPVPPGRNSAAVKKRPIRK
jgi:hypothetical protein